MVLELGSRQCVSEDAGQMVLEPGSGWCISEGDGPPRGVDCEIPHQLERESKHSL